jgi:glycosyltransferase involved in cell wall biosynthesis
MEAMACSILTNVGGISEYAEHAINCLLVSPNKPQPIFEAFERIQNSEKLKLELQQGALKTALEFSHKHEANETLCYFEEIVMIGKWCKY